MNERHGRVFFRVMVSIVGHPTGGEPLMLDVRQSGAATLTGAGAAFVATMTLGWERHASLAVDGLPDPRVGDEGTVPIKAT